MIITSNEAKQKILEWLFGQRLIVHLFTFPTNPSEEDIAADYEEPQGGGYRSIPLEPNRWQIDAENTSTYPIVTFLISEPVGNIYGYFITMPTGELVLSERFEDGPYNVEQGGQRIGINISIS